MLNQHNQEIAKKSPDASACSGCSWERDYVDVDVSASTRYIVAATCVLRAYS